jgi:hypothetical protein
MAMLAASASAPRSANIRLLVPHRPPALTLALSFCTAASAAAWSSLFRYMAFLLSTLI